MYPVFHVIPHTLGITAQTYELPHKWLKYPELRLSAVITIEDFQKTGSGLFLKTSSRHYFTLVRFLVGFVRKYLQGIGLLRRDDAEAESEMRLIVRVHLDGGGEQVHRGLAFRFSPRLRFAAAQLTPSES